MDDCKLVELVRENPCLYDVTHAQYRLINMREQVWTKVAEILKQPVNDCKARWIKIRKTFIRRKINKKISVRKRKGRRWYLDNQLEFLNIDIERETLTDTTTNDSENHTEIVELETIMDTSHLEEENNLQETEVPSKNKRCSMKRKNLGVSQLYKKNSEVGTKLLEKMLPQNEHPIDAFFKSLAISVKNLSLANQVRARHEICRIICQLELKEIADQSSSTLHIL